MQNGQKFPLGAFGAHGESGAFGAHGILRSVALATNCWPEGWCVGGPQWVRFASPQLAPTAPAPQSSLLSVQCNRSLFFVIAVRVFNGWG